MKKALIVLLAFVMVVSAGMGFGAAADNDIGTGDSAVHDADHGQHDGDNLDDGQSEVDDDDQAVDGDDEDEKDPKDEATIIIIQKKIISILYCNSAAAAGGAAGAGAGAGANNAANKGAGKTVPMQKTGLPILPAVLSTLMIGSGLLYGRLRN